MAKKSKEELSSSLRLGEKIELQVEGVKEAACKVKVAEASAFLEAVVADDSSVEEEEASNHLFPFSFLIKEAFWPLFFYSQKGKKKP